MLDTTHLHITTWVLGVILFFVALSLHNKGNAKGSKIVHMITRLFYVLIIFTGGYLFFVHSSLDAALYGVKFILGILTIGFMEMTLVRKKKGKPANLFIILFAVSLIVTILLGFRLPVGFNFLM